MLTKLKINNQGGSQAWEIIRAQVDDQVFNQVYNQVYNQVWKSGTKGY
jgi:hypothetical protein